MALVGMVHPCGTSMTMIVKRYILLGTLQYTDYDLPRTAHTRFLTHIAGVPHVNLNLKCRFAQFLYKAINSQKERIAFLAKLCMYKTMSIAGSNVSHMCEFNINMSDIINSSASNLMKRAYTDLMHFLLNNGNVT